MDINFQRLTSQKSGLPSFKSHQFPVGAKITFLELRTEDTTPDSKGNSVAHDKIECTVTNAGERDGEYLLPVRELMKMKTAKGGSIYKHESGEETAKLPAAISITEASDRTDRDGKLVFPSQAYTLFQSQIDSGNGIDWNALVAGGVKPDNKLGAVQNYKIELA